MDQKLNKKWVIAQIKPNSYKTAIQNLERQDFEIFLPKMEITKRENNKFIVKKVHVFPGYIFVAYNPHRIAWSKINSTYGVSKIVAFNKKPAEISCDLIQELKIRYEGDTNTKQSGSFQSGDSIKFYAGPFTDLIGRVETVDENNRIWVLLESMGGHRRLKLKSTKNIDILTFKD